MNVNEILENPTTNVTVEDVKTVFDQMKEKNFFDLSETQRLNLIDIICEKSDKDLAIDYLFHVLDNEITYPMDDEKVKVLFQDERMIKMKNLMVDKLQEEDAQDAE